MGLSYTDCKRLGIEHLWPESRELPPELRPVPPLSKHVDDGMNKLERQFWGRLQDAGFPHVYREPMTFRLAGRTTYKPDFLSVDGLGRMTAWEVKGFMRDDAAVKIKVAADLYGWIDFVLVTRLSTPRRWECRYVSSRGISNLVWTPEWLM